MEPASSSVVESARAAAPSQPHVAARLIPRVAFVAAWVFEFVCGAVVGAALVYELETSALEAALLTRYTARMSFQVEEGASETIAFPKEGPFDVSRGYARIPDFLAQLYQAGYRIRRQARQSAEMVKLIRSGIAPPYREPAVAGLVLRGGDGSVLLDAARGRGVFERFEEIPPEIVNALVFIENRELLNPRDPRNNPAIEWDRLVWAMLSYVGGHLGLRLDLQGGSTLAVQLEKYRHSPSGRTTGVIEKFRQIAGASLKAYREGPDTTRARQEIVLDYLNTMPLAAVPGVGEVNGLGAGLRGWFGADLQEVVAQLAQPTSSAERAKAFKQVLFLLAAVRAPTEYLVLNRSRLEQRVSTYLDLLVKEGKLDPDFAASVRSVAVDFVPRVQPADPPPYIERKGINALRSHLMQLLGIGDVYELHRLHLVADSTVDTELQQRITQLLLDLRSPEFVRSRGLHAERLLRSGDPQKVIYSLLLFERTPEGNVARVHTDTLDQPFDINDGIKMELGSTAKARTLAHYLEVIEELFYALQELTPPQRAEVAKTARDPLTEWVATEMAQKPDMDLETLLARALERKYSASPAEAFFTGGGLHTFGNFDRDDDSRVLTVRDALRRSTNLVFIRLMRDLVRYHQARLPYDAQAILADSTHPLRLQMLQEIAEAETRQHLRKAYRRFRLRGEPEITAALLGKNATSARHLSVLFFAWRRGNDELALGRWLNAHGVVVDAATRTRLFRAYKNPRLTWSDYGYLLGRHPIDVWLAGELVYTPTLTWEEVVERSKTVGKEVSAWLFRPKNKRAQDLRLRIRIEQDAFARMTPYWQRLGFPFARLVPSLATAIGNSSDRPMALAEFVGILVNDGVRKPLLRVQRLHFAQHTPYETELAPSPRVGERVMSPTVARAMRQVLTEVVEQGTARRLRGAFVRPDGSPAIVGGKTGSGDNRFKTFRRGGGVISARVVNRTATFFFFVDNRFFGVVTAHVPGPEAAGFEFTSALPVTVLKMAAPAINERL